MKALITFSVLLLLLSLTGLNAQPGKIWEPIIPLQQNRSPLFGKDIIINNIPTEDQRNVTVCSAFNGWLYACYWRMDATGSGYSYFLLRSIDNGINWTNLFADHYLPYGNEIITKMDLIACGDSIPNIKVFWGLVFTNLTYFSGQGIIARFNGLTGDFEDEILQDQDDIHDLALASDYMYPATNSNPNSIAVLYSKYYYGYESLIFKSSSNGGMSFDHSQEINLSNLRYYHHVDLAYGRCPSKNSGRYFAIWEDWRRYYDSVGHIYTAHTEPNFNSSMTTPVCLDSLDPTAINKCRRPTIACQFDNTDNDSSDLTQIVSFERFNTATNNYTIKGYYNERSTVTNHFRELSFVNSTHNNVEADMDYNPFNRTFMVTYYDSTTQKLPYLINDVNMSNPNNWNQISSGYNDDNIIGAPFPIVKLNLMQQGGMNAWISEGVGGNGIAMFDAPYSNYTGISGNSNRTLARLYGAYPNPCSNEIKIAFELKKSGKVTITVLSIFGQPLGTITDQSYSEGKHVVPYNVSDFPAGTYLYNFRSGDFTASGKFTVVR